MVKQYLFIVIVLLLTASALFAAPEVQVSTLDITRTVPDLPTLPVVTTKSAPAEITAAIQERLDYLYAHHLAGRVYLPAGEWQIDRPLFITGDRKELVGAGIGQTLLRAADGFRAMPLVNMGVRSYHDERPLQTCNRVRLTDPAARVLDDSVTGDCYGVRTYAEYPATHFPQGSHAALPTPAPLKAWAEGAAYAVNDIIAVTLSNTRVSAVCVQAHTANTENKPTSGAHWQDYWVLRLGFNMQFFADPLTAGAYNPENKRASDWQGMDKFTFDFAFTLNTDPAVYPDWRPICGPVTNNCGESLGHTWLLALREGGQLEFNLTLADGTPKNFVLATKCQAGTYRLALQLDFTTHTLQAWLRKPGEGDFTRVVNDASLPAGAGFKPQEYGYFCVAGGETGNPIASNRYDVPTDLTVCGLHLANALRYADTAELRARETPDRGPALPARGAQAPTTDQFRYFTQTPDTIAFLPLTDNPRQDELCTYGRLITVQHGAAAGDAAQKGYGYLQTPTDISGISDQSLSDMTLQPGSTWGMGVVTWHTLDPKFWNLDIRGGYYAIGDLCIGAQYTLDLRDCLLSGSEAAFNGSSNIFYLHNVTINPVGRCGILVSGSNCVLDGVQFIDPQTHRSDYYFRHIMTELYGGMNTLTHVSALNPAGCQYPAKAAFSVQHIASSRTCMLMSDCTVTNIGTQAAFLDLPYYSADGHGVISLEHCCYTGSPIAAFLRTDSPCWSGPVQDFDVKTPVKQWVDYAPPPFAPWGEHTAYQPGALVINAGQGYRCIAAHTADTDNQPGTIDGEQCWQPAISQFVFETPKP